MCGTSGYTEPGVPDYVPEPRPARTDYLIGAHYFPGWKEGTHYGWGVLRDFPGRTPLLGYYDEGSPEAADWEIKWCLEHGINFFVYCWYRDAGNAGKPVTVEAARLGHAIHEGLFHARYRDRFRFAIMWENFGRRGVIASLDDLCDNLLPFWVENYFTRANYLKLGNKPVLFVYHLPTLIEQAGGAMGARRALDIMRAGCRRGGFDDLIVMCEYRGTDRKFLEQVCECGFDASFAYCWHPPGRFPSVECAVEFQMQCMNTWRDIGVLPFVPTASVGWDPMPWKNDKPDAPWLHLDKMTRWFSTPDEFRSLLVRVKGFMDSLPEGHFGRRMLLLDNWNEWGEGHYISPHAAGGFGYLEAVREVFTARDNLPDYRTPQQLRLGPYDSLYRQKP